MNRLFFIFITVCGFLASSIVQAQNLIPHVSVSIETDGDNVLVTVSATKMNGWESLHFAAGPAPVEPGGQPGPGWPTAPGLPHGGQLTGTPAGWGESAYASGSNASFMQLSTDTPNSIDSLTWTIKYDKQRFKAISSTDTLYFFPDDGGEDLPYKYPVEFSLGSIFNAVVAVPEPSSILLVAVGLACVGLRLRRGRQ